MALGRRPHTISHTRSVHFLREQKLVENENVINDQRSTFVSDRFNARVIWSLSRDDAPRVTLTNDSVLIRKPL